MSVSEQGRSGWRAVLAEMVSGAREAVSRFPVTVILLLLMALDASFLIEGDGLFSGGGSDFVLPFLAGALASLAASLFSEARKLDRWVYHSGAVLAALLGFGLVRLDLTAQTLVWALLPALGGLVFVAPFLGGGGSRAFWLFGVRLAFAVVLAGLALLLFAGGISAILASLTYLFDIPVPESLYAHVWTISGLFGAPLFGLGQIPHEFHSEPDATATGFMERGMRALGDFVAAPLLIVYAAILHLYAIKIVATGAVPKGQIGWLVLAFGFCVFGALILINPFLSAARAPTRLVLRFWPVALPVPLVLLGYALFLRIGQYGVTPDRYLLALFGLVAAVLVVLQLFPRTRGDIRIMAALPVFAVILASFGPQGAVATSIRSQADRFLAIVRHQPVEGRRHDEALSALLYLTNRKALARVAPPGFSDWDAEGGPYRAVAKAYGLNPNRRPFGDGLFSVSFAQPEAFATTGYDIGVANMALHRASEEPVTVRLPSGESLQLSLTEGGLTAATGQEEVRFEIDEERLRAIARSGVTGAPRLVLTSGGRSIALIPTFLHGRLEPEPRLDNFTGTLLLRSRDW